MKKKTVMIEEDLLDMLQKTADLSGRTLEDVVNVMLAFYMVKLGAEAREKE